MPPFRLHDFLSGSLAHTERITNLLLLCFVVMAAMAFGISLRRQVRKSWLGESPYQPKTWASALRLAALVLVGIAATDPRIGRGTNDAGRSGEQIVLLLDRSRSMLAADNEPTPSMRRFTAPLPSSPASGGVTASTTLLRSPPFRRGRALLPSPPVSGGESRVRGAADTAPTRFSLARQVAADVIDRAQGAAFAIVSFASDARIDSPLSRDPSRLREQLETLEPEQDERSGTELARGLTLAMDCFASRFVGPKRLIVLTDGETHGPVSLAGVRILKDVDVLFLGIGDPINGARIPLKPGENNGGDSPQYLTYQGKTVWTKSQPKNLGDLAHRLNGQSQMITSVAEGSRIISVARGDVKKSLHWQRLATATPIYPTLLFVALLLLVLESVQPFVDRRHVVARSHHRGTTGPPSPRDPSDGDGSSLDRLGRHGGGNSPRTALEEVGTNSPRPPSEGEASGVRGATITIAFLAMLALCSLSGASPPPDIAETYNRGVEAYRSAAWQEAEAQFRLAVASGDEQISRQTCFNLANTQYQLVRKGGMSKQEAMSRLQECIACYRRCIQENQRPADARANLQIVYALLKQIEKQEPKNGQSGSKDNDQGSKNPPPPSNNPPAERAEGDKPRQSGEKPSLNSSRGNASKPDKPDQTAMSPPPEMTGDQTPDKLTDRAAEDEVRRIRDQARRHGPGKKPTLAGPTVPGGPPW